MILFLNGECRGFITLIHIISSKFQVPNITITKLSKNNSNKSKNWLRRLDPCLSRLGVQLGCLILTWYFYERSPLITNSYHCWQIPSFKPFLQNLSQIHSLLYKLQRLKATNLRIFRKNGKKWIKSFCVDLWRWMKHAFTTILRKHVKVQNSGLNLVKVLRWLPWEMKDDFWSILCCIIGSIGWRNQEETTTLKKEKYPFSWW